MAATVGAAVGGVVTRGDVAALLGVGAALGLLLLLLLRESAAECAGGAGGGGGGDDGGGGARMDVSMFVSEGQPK